LQKKKAELESQLLSLDEKEKALQEMGKVFDEKLMSQEKRLNDLEKKLEDQRQFVEMLEFRTAEIERKLVAEKQPEIAVLQAK